jgi:hypothetical protein
LGGALDTATVLREFFKSDAWPALTVQAFFLDGI